MEPCKVTDINIAATRELPAPAQLLQEIPRTEEQQAFVAAARREIHRIIFGNDKRLLLVVGPCSIHDIAAGREYAQRLAKLAAEVRERVLIVMRVYFEKPRTTVGWKGLIMDPFIDKSYNIPAGLRMAREFLREVIDLGLPTATEQCGHRREECARAQGCRSVCTVQRPSPVRLRCVDPGEGTHRLLGQHSVCEHPCSVPDARSGTQPMPNHHNKPLGVCNLG